MLKSEEDESRFSYWYLVFLVYIQTQPQEKISQGFNTNK